MADAATGSAPTRSSSTGSSTTTRRHDHGFHRIGVARVVAETADAGSIVLDVPDDLRDAFAYESGQFCTFRVEVDGSPLLRCYSMSSAPTTDDRLAVTVKRVPGGAVSNWLLDNVTAGSELEVTRPAGVFTLHPDEDELVAFAAGSGITPVFSLLKTALAETDRHVRLLYANRDRDSVIFASQLDDLVAAHGDRLEVTHHHDADGGFLDAEAIVAFLDTGGHGHGTGAPGYYLCGPTPFMDLVESTLLDAGARRDHVHLERFTPAEEADVEETPEDGCRITIELDGRTESGEHHAGTTILQTARQFGMAPPFSCESGSCATCMGRLVTGTVEMSTNNALTDDEVAAGWILTCQSVPTSSEVGVVYGYD